MNHSILTHRCRYACQRRRGGTEAFTRLELAALLASLVFLGLVVLPALANNRDRSARQVCLNNLRLIGQAYAEWGSEHSGRVPCRTPFWEGGTQVAGSPPPGVPYPSWALAGFQNNAWFQFAWITNELRSAKFLVCPSDGDRVIATDWGAGASNGFVHPNFQGRAASYIISLDVLPQDALGLLSGDRNLRRSGVSGNCSSGVAPSGSLTLNQPSSFGISGGLHVQQGNYLLSDGRVEELTSTGFVGRMQEIYSVDDAGSIHYLAP